MTTSIFRKSATISVLAGTLLLAGCTAYPNNQNETVGTLLGAAAGAWAGSSIGKGDGQIVATAVGTMLGAAVGNQIGRSMDEMDRLNAGRAQSNAYAAPIGQRISWNNPRSGNYGNVTAVRDGYSSSGQYCREFQTEVTIDGTRQSGFGTACQQRDGSWKIVN